MQSIPTLRFENIFGEGVNSFFRFENAFGEGVVAVKGGSASPV